MHQQLSVLEGYSKSARRVAHACTNPFEPMEKEPVPVMQAFCAGVGNWVADEVSCLAGCLILLMLTLDTMASRIARTHDMSVNSQRTNHLVSIAW